MAVVLAHAAAELCTEATMIALLGAHVAGKLVEPLRGVFPTYDICSERLLDFYIALSGDSIQKALFWTKLKDSRKRRNLIVHKGKKCSPKDAGDSLKVIGQLVKHMGTIATSQRAPGR